MRILNIEGSYFVSCFQRLEHDVLSVGGQDGCDVRLEKPLAGDGLIRLLREHNFWPDLVLWSDTCQPPTVLGFELLPCPIIGFSIDQYCNPWHVPWSFCFDAFLVAQKDYLHLFRTNRTPRTVEWLPLFFKHLGRLPEAEERDVPVSFVGTVGGSINFRREKFLADVGRHLPLLVRGGDYKPIYSRSQIVLNQSAAGEINFRFFEGPGCGALLVTEQAENGLAELLEPGEEIAVYECGNPADAVRVCRELLTSPDRMRAMASAGQRRVLREHCVLARARHILTLAEKLLAARSWEWRIAHRDLVRQELAKTFTFLGSDDLLPLPPQLAQEYLRLGSLLLKDV